MSDPNWRLQLYLMKEHIGKVLDGEAELHLGELWLWMEEILHPNEEE